LAEDPCDVDGNPQLLSPFGTFVYKDKKYINLHTDYILEKNKHYSLCIKYSEEIIPNSFYYAGAKEQLNSELLTVKLLTVITHCAPFAELLFDVL